MSGNSTTRPSSKPVRCAIYTRVSTDQGLDQEFNSLDAQREASEAYIKSQAHEGWTCLKQAYDDGGYSGGSMERPALQRLLEEVRAKRLDVIVVYKVDRLTRSLADFAKLVELFDAHQVSFVSVTQSFNTTSSMGRLTLNVLLSFAQFEREVTGERIRDKFAASKKKGMWMGGNVPLGYRLGDRKLVVDTAEAETVKLIFLHYLELQSIPKLAARLAELGILSRTRVLKGRTIGGQPFRTGALSHLLANRVYIGEVKHHDQYYPGEHEPILDKGLFDAVQTGLRDRLNRHSTRTSKSGALLQGLLFDSAGNRMSPAHSRKRGLRHRYYQSWVLNHGQKGRAGAVSRVPAQAIEDVVLDALKAEGAEAIQATEEVLPPKALWEQVERIDVLEDKLTITFKPQVLSHSDGQNHDTKPPLTIAWVKQSRRRKKEIIGSVGDAPRLPMRAKVRSRLLKGIAQGRIWMDTLISHRDTTLADIAKQHNLSERSIRSTLSLALLAPEIVDAALEGQLPRGLTVTQMADLPTSWSSQKLALGLA